MTQQHTIWCNAEFPEEVTARLKAGTAGHRLVIDNELASNLGSSRPSPLMAGADVAFGQPNPEQIVEQQGLRWVHLTSAGYTRYDRDDLRRALKARDSQLTNSSSVFDEPCAQHLLAFILAQARQLPASMADQLRSRGWIYEDLRPKTRLLAAGQTVLILGFGAIARRLVEILAPFRMNLIAIRQRVKGDEPIATFAATEVGRLIPVADHIVDILPANPSTVHFVNAPMLSLAKPGAHFYNIGRGTTVDQDALIEALSRGQLGSAYLDVTDPEPLPPGHRLWTAPNCFITPHIGGGHAEEYPRLVDHFLANLDRFERGEPLLDRVM